MCPRRDDDEEQEEYEEEEEEKEEKEEEKRVIDIPVEWWVNAAKAARQKSTYQVQPLNW